MHLLPEQNKVALLEDIGYIDNLEYGLVAHLSGEQQILAKDKVAERKIGERFQKNQVRDAEINMLGNRRNVSWKINGRI